MKQKLAQEFQSQAIEEFKAWLAKNPSKTAPDVDDILGICGEVGVHGYVRGLKDSASIVRSYSSKNMVEDECIKIAKVILAVEDRLIKGATQ